MTKFEYAVLTFDTTTFLVDAKLDHAKFHAKLNEYGQVGWELVSIFDMSRFQGRTFEVVAVLKRPCSA